MQLENREISITTPEHVNLQFKTAGIGSRIGAQIIDTAILIAINAVLILSVVTIFNLDSSPVLIDVEHYIIAGSVIALFVLNWSYFIVQEYFMGGQTVGKRLAGLRVIQDNGQSITFLSALIRNFFRVIDLLPSFYFLGALVSFLHPKDKRIGDLVAGTVVVVEAESKRLKVKEKATKEIEKMGPATISLTIDDYAKPFIGREDWRLLSTYIERLPTLSQEKKVALGYKIAERFIAKLRLEDKEKFLAQPQQFLIVLYQQLKGDWEF